MSTDFSRSNSHLGSGNLCYNCSLWKNSSMTCYTRCDIKMATTRSKNGGQQQKKCNCQQCHPSYGKTLCLLQVSILFKQCNILHMLIKIQPDATVCRYLFTAKSLYMFWVSQHLSSGVLKTVCVGLLTSQHTLLVHSS